MSFASDRHTAAPLALPFTTCDKTKTKARLIVKPAEITITILSMNGLAGKISQAINEAWPYTFKQGMIIAHNKVTVYYPNNVKLPQIRQLLDTLHEYISPEERSHLLIECKKKLSNKNIEDKQASTTKSPAQSSPPPIASQHTPSLTALTTAKITTQFGRQPPARPASDRSLLVNHSRHDNSNEKFQFKHEKAATTGNLQKLGYCAVATTSKNHSTSQSSASADFSPSSPMAQEDPNASPKPSLWCCWRK